MGGDVNVTERFEMPDYTDKFVLPETVKSVKWLDSSSDLDFIQQNGRVTVCFDSQKYGESLVVKVARIEV